VGGGGGLEVGGVWVEGGQVGGREGGGPRWGKERAKECVVGHATGGTWLAGRARQGGNALPLGQAGPVGHDQPHGPVPRGTANAA